MYLVFYKMTETYHINSLIQPVPMHQEIETLKSLEKYVEHLHNLGYTISKIYKIEKELKMQFEEVEIKETITKVITKFKGVK